MSLKTFAAIGLIAAAVALTLNTAYQRGYTAGANQVTTDRATKDLASAKSDNRKLIEQTNRADRLQTALSTLEQSHHQKETDAQAENQRLRTALRTGAVRLSIPTAKPVTNAQCPARPVAENTSPATNHLQTRAELDPATADALVAITDDGDDAIRDLNACIDRYSAVARAQNATLAHPLDR